MDRLDSLLAGGTRQFDSLLDRLLRFNSEIVEIHIAELLIFLSLLKQMSCQ